MAITSDDKNEAIANAWKLYVKKKKLDETDLENSDEEKTGDSPEEDFSK